MPRQLIAGSRDVIIVPSRNKRSDLDYSMLFEERQSLYRARGHPLFTRRDRDITAAALSEHAFVARGYLHSEDLKRIGHRRAEATVDTMEAQLVLILTGEFVGYLPAHYAQPWIDRAELRCLRDEAFNYNSTFYAVVQSGSTESPLARRFLSAVAAATSDRSAAGERRIPSRGDRF
jgi:DNA-binding transcriptional LysR family regulator